jgi:beta-glucanase (GH16 family)
MLLVKQEGSPAAGTRISTTRYIQYGKISAKFRSSSMPGSVTAFITMSEVKDEIDWEILGANPHSAETNVFYRGIPEYSIHGTRVDGPFISSGYNIFTIDWRPDQIIWSINNRPVRILKKAESTSKMIGPNERWFPTTPSQVQFSIWDAGNNEWAKGPIKWGNQNHVSAALEYIDIYCY